MKYGRMLIPCMAWLCAMGAAMAADGLLGIDHRLNFDESGIWARSNQLAIGAAHPEVVVEVVVSEELVDLARNGFDAGIRMGEFIAADMVAVRLTPPLRLIVVGSPDYFARCGRPRTPADLANHACVRTRRSNGAVAIRWANGPRSSATVYVPQEPIGSPASFDGDAGHGLAAMSRRSC